MSSRKRRKNKPQPQTPDNDHQTDLLHSTPPVECDHAPDAPAVDAALATAPDEVCASMTAIDTPSSAALGARLRAAREAQKISLEDAGRKLRLPARVLHKLEDADFVGIDYPVYLCGYLRSYSKLLGTELPPMQSTIEHAAVAAPTLAPTGGVSHGRYLLQRYSAAATYLVFTALIVVPVVVLGLSSGLRHDIASVAPLQAIGVPTTASSASGLAPPASLAQEQPLMASMAPFAALHDDLEKSRGVATANDTSSAAVARVAPPPDEHHLDIQLGAPSWVEITDASGTRLEYGLLAAGNYRYHSNQVLDVRLGNSADASVDVDGVTFDLQPYRRANVAHFRIDPTTGQPPQS